MALPTLHTPRVRLRPWTLDDIDALHTLWSAPDMRRYLWDDSVITRDTAAKVVKSHLETQVQHAIGYWALHIPPPDDSIGGFVGFRFIDERPEIELMYGLAAAHWGKGLATEACAVAIDYVWRSTAFHRLYARTHPPNEKSVEVMRRLGMTLESVSATTITYLLRRALKCRRAGRPSLTRAFGMWPIRRLTPRFLPVSLKRRLAIDGFSSESTI